MATTTLYQQWADAFASVGECHLSLDTCCKLLAVVYVYGGEDASFRTTRTSSPTGGQRRGG